MQNAFEGISVRNVDLRFPWGMWCLVKMWIPVCILSVLCFGRSGGRPVLSVFNHHPGDSDSGILSLIVAVRDLPVEEQCMHACLVVSDSMTPWTVACQAPVSMGLSQQGC